MGTLEPGLMNEAEQSVGKEAAWERWPCCHHVFGITSPWLQEACCEVGWSMPCAWRCVGVSTLKHSLCLTSVVLSSDPKVFLLRRKDLKYIQISFCTCYYFLNNTYNFSIQMTNWVSQISKEFIKIAIGLSVLPQDSTFFVYSSEHSLF